MTESGRSKYKKIVKAIYHSDRFGAADYRANWHLICVVFNMELGMKDEDKILNDVQNMCYMGYLVPRKAGGIGVMDRIYEIGEAGMRLIEEKEPQTIEKDKKDESKGTEA
jgi:hypothetical protein